MTDEKWLPVKDYEGIYEVSSHGRVRSLDRRIRHSEGFTRKRKGQILRPTINSVGYASVSLYRDGKEIRRNIHRLVSEAFLANLSQRPCVNHKNSDRTDNRVTNLEWCTYSENSEHAAGKGRLNVTKRKKVLCVETGIVFPSVTAAANAVKGSHGNICQVLLGRRSKHKGYSWRYLS